MKNQPQMPNRSGKSTLTLRNFLNNLKENDLHYDNKQITQCVFLGVLRLKPVPSIFSQNNVPSVSAPVENNRPKSIRNNNSNKRLSKNVSKKSDINTVLSGKVSKRNPQKVKSAVKKVPDKKPSFKIKLHTKKKTSKLKKNVQQSPNDRQIAPTNSPECSLSLPRDPLPSTPTIGLSPLTCPAKFNPVQNLFDKLKQKIDLSHCEAGPSSGTKKTNGGPGPSGVCKINAKRETNPTNRKSKKTVQRKPLTRESGSPITISDSESTGKKDDVINVDGNNFLDSRGVVDDVSAEKESMEDIIFVNEDPKPVKHKERTSPRSKMTTLTRNKEEAADNFELHGVMVINDEQKSTKGKRRSPPKQVREKDQFGDIIFIADDPKTNVATSTTNKAHNNSMYKGNNWNAPGSSKNDVIVIDELRVSPRMKTVEVPQRKPIEIQSSNTTTEAVVDVDEVSVTIGEANRIPELNKMHTALDKTETLVERSAKDKSKTLELNITIDDHQPIKNKGKTSPRLLKVVENVDLKSVIVKKELIQSNEEDVIVVSEKPRQRKTKLKPSLIPPMFLNAPMLLRSELAPRKAAPSVCEKLKRKERSTSKLLRSDMTHTKYLKNVPVTISEKNYFTSGCENSNISKRKSRSSKFLWPELSNKAKSGNFPQASGSKDVIFVDDQSKTSSRTSSSKVLKSGAPEKVDQTNLQEIDLETKLENDTPDSLCQSHLVDLTTPEPSQESKIHGDIIILNEEPFEEQIYAGRQTTSTRLLRSELAQQKSSGNNKEHLTKTRQRSAKNAPEVLDEDEKIKPTKKTSPRLLRSDLAKQKIIETPKDDKEALQIDFPEEAAAEISDLGNKQSNSDKSSNIQYAEQSLGKVEEVMVIENEPTPKRVSPRLLKPEVKVETPKPNEAEEILVINDDRDPVQKEQPLPRSLRSDVAPQKTKPKSLQRIKQIDLDEIVVVSEKRIKKPKERSISGRLLRSELALQKSRELVPVKAEVEEVIVLIHDEPKPKQKSESLQTSNKNINIQEQVIVVTDEPLVPNQKVSPRSLRSDTNQKQSPENTPPETKLLVADEAQEGAKTEKRRFLRSEQNVCNPSTEDTRSPVEKQKIPEWGSSPKKYPELVPKDQPIECYEAQTPPSTPQTVLTELSPKSLPAGKSNSPSSGTAEQQKLIKSVIASRRSPRAKDQPGNFDTEQDEIEQPSRLLRSQHSPRNLLEDSSVELVKTEITKNTSQCLSKTLNDLSEDVDLVTICVSDEDIQVKSELCSSRLLRSDIVSMKGSAKPNEQSTVKQPAKQSTSSQPVDTDDVRIRMQSSPRSLRSEISSQRSPTALSKQQSTKEIFTISESLQELPAKVKGKRGRPRKTHSLLIDSKAKLKTPMLLRSELAQLKNLDADTQKQVPKTIKKRGRKPKVTYPASNVEVSIQEPARTSKGKTPKRKSLIDDLKRKTSPKQKAIAMQSLNSPEIILQPETAHGGRSESQVVSDEDVNILTSDEPKALEPKKLKTKNSPKQKTSGQNLSSPEINSELKAISEELSIVQVVNNEDSEKTVAYIAPSPSGTDENVKESSTGATGKSQDAPKAAKRKNSPKQKSVATKNLSSPQIISETISEEVSIVQIVNNDGSNKTIPSHIIINENVEETPSGTIRKYKNKTQDAPKTPRKKLAKQKPMTTQNLSSPQTFSDPETIFEGVSEVQIVNDDDSNKTIANIPSPVRVNENVEENSTGITGKYNNKAQGTPKAPKGKKSPKQKSIATQNLSSPQCTSETETISDDILEVQIVNDGDSKKTTSNIIPSPIRIDQNVEENPSGTIGKYKNRTQDAPKTPRKKLPKQKSMATQNLSSPQTISEPETISEAVSLVQIVNDDDSKKTVANIIPSPIRTNQNVEENSSGTIEKYKNKTRDAPKTPRKKLPKQKSMATRNLSSPQTISETETISEDVPAVQIVNDDDSKKIIASTVANISPSPIRVNENVEENSTGITGKNNKAQGAPKAPKGKKSPKQKSIATQDSSSPQSISETETISKESPINNTSRKETVANIPSDIEENSTTLNCNGKSQDDVKSRQKAEKTPPKNPIIDKAQGEPECVMQQTNIEKDPGVEPIECPPKFDLEKIPEEDSQKNITKHPLKSKNKAPDADKSVKPKTKAKENLLKRKNNSKEKRTSVKPRLRRIKSTVGTSCSEIQLVNKEQSSPGLGKKRVYAKRKPKVSKAIELSPPPKAATPTEDRPEEFNIIKTPEKAPKQIDTTVYDFDETEPEVVPLRLSSPRRNRRIVPEDSTESLPSKSNEDDVPKPKKRRLDKASKDDSKTKAQAKAKLLAMFGDKPPQQDKPASPEKPKGKSTKTKRASKTRLNKEQSENNDKTNAFPAKAATSPMKQSTITDLFSKAIVKNEKAALAESVFGPATSSSPPENPLKEAAQENSKTDMAPPKAERKANAEDENEFYDDDDDSDCESRVEWMPEEYAEYKFKYSAKKMMSCRSIYKCKICLLILPTYYRLFRHREQHAKMQNPYSCPQCEKSFPSIDELTAHLRVHKGKHPYTCIKCDVGFWSKKALDAHAPIHVLKKVKQPNKRFRCDVCAREFTKLCDVERHMRVHTGEKPCVCNICNKRFQQSHNLSKHLLTHLHVKPFHCEICNMQFGRNDVLNRHLLIHSVDKPMKCVVCSKGFIRKSQLNNHMVKIHPDAPRTDTMAETTAEAAN